MWSCFEHPISIPQRFWKVSTPCLNLLAFCVANIPSWVYGRWGVYSGVSNIYSLSKGSNDKQKHGPFKFTLQEEWAYPAFSQRIGEELLTRVGHSSFNPLRLTVSENLTQGWGLLHTLRPHASFPKVLYTLALSPGCTQSFLVVGTVSYSGENLAWMTFCHEVTADFCKMVVAWLRE